ncbi:helix-turn-helix domain-containing protein [Ursidibacter arcticus]
MSISNRLREVMECKGLNIKAFAELLDVPYRTLQNYLLNERVPSADILIKISLIMKVDLNWLLVGSHRMFLEYSDNNLYSDEMNLLEHYRSMTDSGKRILIDTSKILLKELKKA